MFSLTSHRLFSSRCPKEVFLFVLKSSNFIIRICLGIGCSGSRFQIHSMLFQINIKIIFLTESF